MTFRFVISSATIEFADAVLDLFNKHRQRHPWSAEAGGQLFCSIQDDMIRVEKATGPGHQDKRSRYSFLPNRTYEQRDIERHFSAGLHYVGDWHTHPEDEPSPSSDDIRKIQAIFRQSDHQLKCMLLVVVGRTTGLNGLWLGAVSNDGVIWSSGPAVSRTQFPTTKKV